jgi:hypothetical protein
MRLTSRRWDIAPLVILCLVATACTAGNDVEATTTTVPTTITTTTPATTTTAEATTTVGQDLEAFCDAYLAFISAGDPESRVEPLNNLYAERGPDAPADLNEVVNVLVSADYGSQDVRAEQAVLRDFVMPLCEDGYNSAVVGGESDEAAGQAFFDALVAGDKQTALTLASALAVAMFEPWEPYDAEDTELVIQEGGFWVALSPQFSFSCTTRDGIVTGCSFG